MTLSITPIYAALLTGLLIYLSAQVITYRRRNRLSLGDEGDRHLLQLIRAQGNCAEYVPLGLLLLALVEAQGAPALALHLLGLTLLAGRVLHAVAFSSQTLIMRFRVLGMVLTFTMLALSAFGLLTHALF